MMDLIETLKKLTVEKDMSPERAAALIGCSGQQVRRWFAGKARPTPMYRGAIRAGIEKIKQEAI
jgi:DNA-binding transcriptional regulator YiaG